MKQQTNRIKKYVIIAFALILVASCKEGQTNVTELANLERTIKEKDSIINNLREQLGEAADDKRRIPNNIIQSDFAKEIYHLYDEREELINEVVGQDGAGNDFKATRSLFYDINDLQKYIRYVKRKSRKARVRPTGFRFYFALYPDDYVRDNKEKRYANRQTFFIAPTKEVKNADGNVEQLGYTLDNKFNVALLKDIIGFDSIRKQDGKMYQKAGFFNVNLNNLLEEENSLVANELGASPPMGKDEQ
ncbi:hypothetical protein [uncultured Aquimarina sp.]|uniref:hypothetical protein n=1 Tax=uncultured Aquimarina sp. TaxID=575652 RepID=UPI002628DD7B|nr:hypothetical protein [uncultured Aquimarina sp.]